MVSAVIRALYNLRNNQYSLSVMLLESSKQVPALKYISAFSFIPLWLFILCPGLHEFAMNVGATSKTRIQNKNKKPQVIYFLIVVKKSATEVST
jgi:hypothetical protein